MDFSIQQFIISTVTSAIATAIADIQAENESKMLSLREMIKKSLLFRESSLDSDATSKAHPGADSLPKTTIERWNLTDLGYFDPQLNTKVHGEGKVVLVGKDVYYRNVVLFVQHIQNLVTFKGVTLVKANTPTSLRGSALKWYTSELAKFDRDTLDNDLGMKSWINILLQRFKVPTSVALDLLTNKIYSLDDAQWRQPLA